MTSEKLEQRRLSFPRVEKNLAGLNANFDGAIINANYLNGLDESEFRSGLDALSQTFEAIYTGMAGNPKAWAMKDADDVKGFAKNMNFLLMSAHVGAIKSGMLEIDGAAFASALKAAKVTKPEIYFDIFESAGFAAFGLNKKIESSEVITVDFPDNPYLLTAMKALADAVCTFSDANPNRGNGYFEMVDSRVFEKFPAVEPKDTMEYVLTKLHPDSREVAAMLYDYIKPLAKCQIKGGVGWYWTPTFTLKSTKKVIMSLKLDLVSHDVKLNLANIGKYTDVLADFPAKLIAEIKENGWGCGNCNSKCEGGFAFELDGVAYKKCRCGSFSFALPTRDDARLLVDLLKKEVETVQ